MLFRSGIIRPEILGDQVRVDMGEPRFVTDDWPWAGTKVVDQPLSLDGREPRVTLVSMGNPHCVTFHTELTDEWVLGVGPKLERHPKFPNRINAEFAQVLNPREIRMRVWERGAGETLACGTGACAVGVAAMLNELAERHVTVHLPGGDLEIEWKDGNRVLMTGPAEFVFEGTWTRGVSIT